MVGFEAFKTIIREISAIVGEDSVSTHDSICHVYSLDTSPYSGKAIGVVKPESIEEICEILKIANKHKVPIVPRGFGTGNRGGAVPFNALVLDMTKFNNFHINSKNLMLEAEAGVLFKNLKFGLNKRKLFLPPEPDFDYCTIGGYVATSKSGRRSLKYGNIKDYVTGIDVVLPNGEFVELGSKNFKHSGIDLKDLFIGSEGILGVITRVHCKVLPKPRDMAIVVVNVDNLKLGVELAIEILNEILPASIEYFDSICSKILGFEKECVAIEIDSFSSADKEIEVVEKISRDYGKIEVYKNKNAERLRNEFNIVSIKLKEVFNGFPVVEDFEVKITSLPFVCDEIRKILHENGINYSIYCHLDSGVLHPVLFIQEDGIRKYEIVLDALCDVVKKFGGYVAGEYGMGIVKSKYIDDKTLNILRNLKKIIDPNNIMNPYKMGL